MFAPSFRSASTRSLMGRSCMRGMPDSLYSPPEHGEAYCYRRGNLTFSQIENLTWEGQGTPPSVDPVDGSLDFGNIDSFHTENSTHHLEGDWGRMTITPALPPEVNMDMLSD